MDKCAFISIAILLLSSLRAPCGGWSLIHPLLQLPSLQSFFSPLENTPPTPSLSFSHSHSSKSLHLCSSPLSSTYASISLKLSCGLDSRFHVIHEFTYTFVFNQLMTGYILLYLYLQCSSTNSPYNSFTSPSWPQPSTFSLLCKAQKMVLSRGQQCVIEP